MLLALALVAIPFSPVPVRAQAQAQARGQVLHAARVVGGRSDRPAGRGVIVIRNPDGSQQTLRLVEFN